jgi:hypothetical protein
MSPTSATFAETTFMCVKCFTIKFGSVLFSNLYAVSFVVLEYIFTVLHKRTYSMHSCTREKVGISRALAPAEC